MERNLFKNAVKNKYRFPYKGSINVEALYDLPVMDLNNIYQKLNADLKRENEDSLFEVKNKNKIELQDKIDIIKLIAEEKIAEKDAARKRAETRRKNQRIMELIANKQDEDLKSKSVEELEKLLEDVDSDEE